MNDEGPSTPAPLAAGSKLSWSRELILVLGFYLIYSWVRNQFGSASVDAGVAFANAQRVIDFEEALRLHVEPTIQGWFLELGWFLRFWNIFYGTLHFIVTAFAMIWLYRRHPADYPRWRTIGLTTTAAGLVGFATFPLMPPRLLGDCGEFGACIASPYVDTVALHGGWWTYSSGAIEAVSNQYAAMPSLHFAWAYWSFLVLAPRLPWRSARLAVTAYPWLTVFAIVVTGNHYWIDAVGGAVALTVGYVVGSWLHNRFAARQGVTAPDG